MRRLFGLGVVLCVLIGSVGAAGADTLPPGGTFTDDNGNIHEGFIEAIAAAGITKGCNPPTNDRYCPDHVVTRGQMAAFLVRALNLTDDGGGNTFGDDNGSVFETDIAKLAAADITKGCNPPTNDRYCPNQVVTRGQMAAFLVRALNLTDDGGGNTFGDDNGSVFETDIAKLAAAGITKGCNPPANDHYCPNDPVLRDQMATFLGRALNLTPITPPEQPLFDLAYTRYEGGYAAGIVLSTADGASQELLIADGMTPKFSPDGNRIAYVGLTSGELTVIDPDGSDRRVLTPGIIEFETYTVWGFTWSPDSTQLVFSAYGFQDFNQPDLWTVNVDGSGLTQLTDESSISVTSPDWSPDGSYIAACRSDGYGASVLELYTPQGEGTVVPFTSCDYSWNGDGSSIWYSAFGEIFEYPLASSPILRGVGQNPLPAPDGGRFLFGRFDDPELLVKDLATDAIERLTDNDFNDYGLSWSPDGSLIAFMSDRTEQYHYDVFVMNADGSGVVQISPDGGSDLSWAPHQVEGP